MKDFLALAFEGQHNLKQGENPAVAHWLANIHKMCSLVGYLLQIFKFHIAQQQLKQVTFSMISYSGNFQLSSFGQKEILESYKMLRIWDCTKILLQK